MSRTVALALILFSLSASAAEPPQAPAAPPLTGGSAGTTAERPLARPPEYLGQDPFDDVHTVAGLKELERDLKGVAERVRPSVVLLRLISESGRSSSGTGVIIRKNGLVATCGHVGVAPGRPVEAVLSDGSTISGKTLGQVFEGGIDCGLVQLDCKERELPWTPLGTTVGLAKGDWLVAMGYTHGPAAEKNRPALVRVGRVLGNNEKELLFDAPIDAGDSGGPSFNLRGEVVGLNSRCGRQSWENVATPIDALQSRLEELESKTTREDAAPQRRGRRRNGPGTRFPSGTSDAGKLAVQRDVRLDTVAQTAAESLVRVMEFDAQLAYGTVVNALGLVVTKSSQVSKDSGLQVETRDRSRHQARVVARDAKNDVALLLVELPPHYHMVPVEWDTSAHVVPGAALITPRAFPDSTALGFAAIEVRQSDRDATSTAYMGVRTGVPSKEALEEAQSENAVLVEGVTGGMPAQRAGIVAGELILKVNDEPVTSREALRRTLNAYRIGERVAVEVFGKDGRRTVDLVLAPNTDQNGQVRRGNTVTEISQLSSGFGSVIAHDSITRPDQMGGPVVDLDGRVVGMNIARFDRTATHALPAARMQEIVVQLKASARKARESASASATEKTPAATAP